MILLPLNFEPNLEYTLVANYKSMQSLTIPLIYVTTIIYHNKSMAINKSL
jgi:hypothetical protein